MGTLKTYRETFPDRILDDIGGVFGMGTVRGSAFHFLKGVYSSPKGASLVGGSQVIHGLPQAEGGSMEFHHRRRCYGRIPTDEAGHGRRGALGPFWRRDYASSTSTSSWFEGLFGGGKEDEKKSGGGLNTEVLGSFDSPIPPTFEFK